MAVLENTNETIRPGELVQSKQSDSFGFSFKTRNDALDYANQLVNDSNYWMSIHNVNLCQRYEMGDLDIVATFSSMRNMSENHLVFRAIPLGWEFNTNGPLKIAISSKTPSSVKGNRDNDFVFLGITKLVQSPKKIIPSFVWLKRHHQIENVYGQILGRATWPIYSTLDFSESIPEGEVRSFTAGTGGFPDGVSGLIESGAQSVKSVECNPRQADWHGLNELDFMKILSSIRVLLDDFGVWVTVVEREGFPFKFRRTTLSVFNAIE